MVSVVPCDFTGTIEGSDTLRPALLGTPRCTRAVCWLIVVVVLTLRHRHNSPWSLLIDGLQNNPLSFFLFLFRSSHPLFRHSFPGRNSDPRLLGSSPPSQLPRAPSFL